MLHTFATYCYIHCFLMVSAKGLKISNANGNYAHNYANRDRIFSQLCAQLSSFLGNNRLNPFHCRKFGLDQIYFYRNGLPGVDSPITTDDYKRLYFNPKSNLAHIDIVHGNKMSEYPSRSLMVFELTSTKQASHGFIHPELTNSSTTVELKFSAALPNNNEIFIIGKKTSAI